MIELDRDTLDAVNGGEWQADFVTGLAGGMALEPVLHIAQNYWSTKFAEHFPRTAKALSWENAKRVMRPLRRIR